MLFLAESLSSLWKYFFLVRIRYGVYIIHLFCSLLHVQLSQNRRQKVFNRGALRLCGGLDIQI